MGGPTCQEKLFYRGRSSFGAFDLFYPRRLKKLFYEKGNCRIVIIRLSSLRSLKIIMSKNLKTEPVLRFQLGLPEDLAKVFLEDCKHEDRDMSQMARHILRLHYERVKREKELEEFTRLRQGKSEKIPTYSAEPPRVPEQKLA